jgi:poly-beta-1,6-N-acetyl-D-glucosamine synthase
MTNLRVLLVSPVHNEAAHLARVIEAVAAQTRPPDLWVVVDDASRDDTRAIAEAYMGELRFLRVLATPAGFTAERRDRLAMAAAPRAFNYGLRHVDPAEFTHIGKLDGDVELPADYLERLLAEFEREPALGIAGGALVERHGSRWVPVGSSSETHVRGALKLYSRSCLEAIGGVQERLGWDGADETTARMRGYRTRSFPHLVARHHRHTGAADGRLRGHARWGAGHYILQYPLPWTLARSLKVARSRPVGLSACAYLYGYAGAAIRRVPRTGDEEYRRFMRRELRGRVVRGVRRALARIRPQVGRAAPR